MNRSRAIPFFVAALALAGGTLVLLVRSRQPEPTPMPILSAKENPLPEPLEKLPEAVPEELPEVSPPETGNSPARTAFDRLLEALRTGDKRKINEALDDLLQAVVPDPVPDEQNAAILYTLAFERLTPFTEQEYEILNLATDGKPLTPEQERILVNLLGRNREALDLVHRAARLTQCNFGLDYSKGYETDLSHLSSMIRASKLLVAESLLVEAISPAESERVSRRLADALADEPAVLFQLVRSICHRFAAVVRERAIGDVKLDEDLTALLGSLTPRNTRIGLEKAMHFELYAGVRYVLEGGTIEFLQAVSDGKNEGTPLQRPEDPLIAQGLDTYTEILSEYAQLVGRPYHEIKDRLVEIEETIVRRAKEQQLASMAVLPAVSKAAAHLAEAEATVGASKIAAAIKLHRMRTGVYPASLEELGTAIPADPFTGAPFVYRQEGVGFVIYSVGLDGEDGGGSRENDVVFRSRN